MRACLRILLAAALAACPGAAAAQTASSPTPRTSIEVANGGARPIVAVYTSPPGRRDWGDDLLGKGSLKPGKSMKLTLKAKPDACKVDVSALLDNGDTRVKADVDMCAAAPNVGF